MGKKKGGRKKQHVQKRATHPGASVADAPKSKATGKQFPVPGLMNLGNTCFFNAVIQNISQSHHFKTRLEHLVNSSAYSLELRVSNNELSLRLAVEEQVGPLTRTLSAILGEMQKFPGSSLNPRPLLTEVCHKAPRFRGYQQQDSQELLRYLLDSMRSEEIHRIKRAILASFSVGKKNPDSVNQLTDNDRADIRVYGHQASLVPTFVDEVFGGSLVSTVVCNACGNCSTIHESYLDLSLPIPQDKNMTSPGGYQTRSKKKKHQKAIQNWEEGEQETVVAVPSPKEASPSKHQLKKQRKRQAKEARRSKSTRQTLQEFLKDSNSRAVGQNEPPTEQTEEGNEDELPPLEAIPNAQGESNKDEFPPMEAIPNAQGESNENELPPLEAIPNAQGESNEDEVPPLEAIPNAQGESNEDEVSLEAIPNAQGESNEDEVPLEAIPNAQGESNEDEVPPLEAIPNTQGESNEDEVPPLEAIPNAQGESNEDDTMVESHDSDTHDTRPGTQTSPAVASEGAVAMNKVEEESMVASNPKREDTGTTVTPTEVNLAEPSIEELTKGLAKVKLDTSDVPQRNAPSEEDGQQRCNQDSGILSEATDNKAISRSTENVEPVTQSKDDFAAATPKLRDIIAPQCAPDSVEACLKKFCAPEQLTGNNKFVCAICTKHKIEEEENDKSQNQQASSPHTNLPVETNENSKDVMKLESCEQPKKVASKREDSRGEKVPETVIEPTDDIMAGPVPQEKNEHEIDAVERKQIEKEAGSGSESDVTQSSSNEDGEDYAPADNEAEEAMEELSHEESTKESDAEEEELLSDKEDDKKPAPVENLVYCEATKQLLLNSLPLVLNLHLKRFIQSGRHVRKNNRHISFPTILDMSPFCTPTCQNLLDSKGQILYSLYGVVEHSGGMHGGHYVAYIRVRPPIQYGPQTGDSVANKPTKDLANQSETTSETASIREPTSDVQGASSFDNSRSIFDLSSSEGQWYHISDTHVRTATESEVVKCQAYLLFYERLPLRQL